jgi:hypothetical protein
VTRRLGKNAQVFGKKKPKQWPNQNNATIYTSKLYFKVQIIYTNPLLNSLNAYNKSYSHPKISWAF